MVLLSLPSLIQGSNSLSARFELIFYNGTGLLDPIDYPGPFPYGHTACASYAISLHADDAVGFEHDAVDKVCKTGVVSGPMLEGEEATGSVPLYVVSGKGSSLFYFFRYGHISVEDWSANLRFFDGGQTVLIK